MKDDLEPAKNVLRTFLNEIEEVKAIRKQMSPPQAAQSFTIKDRMPVFDASEFTPPSDEYFQKEDAYIWLYGDAWDFHSLMHRPNPNIIPEYYNQPARPVYQQWRQEEKEVFHRKCEQIPLPADNISLADYLRQLALIVAEKNEHRDVWIESFRCFIQFLREDTEQDQKGFLEKHQEASQKVYKAMAELYQDHPEFRKQLDPFHPQLATFMAKAMRTFADRELK